MYILYIVDISFTMSFNRYDGKWNFFSICAICNVRITFIFGWREEILTRSPHCRHLMMTKNCLKLSGLKSGNGVLQLLQVKFLVTLTLSIWPVTFSSLVGVILFLCPGGEDVICLWSGAEDFTVTEGLHSHSFEMIPVTDCQMMLSPHGQIVTS